MHCSTDSQQTWLKPYIANLLQRYPESVISNVLAARQSFSAYQADPVGFCESTFGETYTDDVKAMMESVRDNPVTVAKSCNAGGKTHAAARVAAWFIKCFPDSQVYTAAAPPEDNLRRLLWGEIGNLVAKFPDVFAEFKQNVLHLERGPRSFLTGVTIPTSGDSAIRQAKFCADADDLFEMQDGSVVRYGDLIGRTDVSVISVDKEFRRKFSTAEFFDNGTKMVWEIELEDGSLVRRTGNHPLYAGWDIRPDHRTHDGKHAKGRIRACQEGWVETYHLNAGHAILCPDDTAFNFGSKDTDVVRLKFLAYMIGDGCFKGKGEDSCRLRFTQENNAQLSEFLQILDSAGIKYSASAKAAYNWSGISIYDEGLTAFARDCGLSGKGSEDKFIPAFVNGLRKEHVATFMSRLFATDGWASLTNKAEIGYCSKSERLVRDVQRLLLRFGVRSKILSKTVRWNHEGESRSGIYWSLFICHATDVVRFTEQIGIYGKEEAVNACLEYSRNRQWSHANWKFEKPGYRWKKIKAIRVLGERPTVGVCVPGDQTYLTSLVEHNSGKHAPHLLFILDEGDAIPDEVYKGIESCMSGGHFRLLVMFNPRAEAGPVYRMERDGLAHVVSISAFNHPNVIEGRLVIPGGAVDRETTVRRINQWCRRLAANEPRDSSAEFFSLPSFLEGATARDQRGRSLPPLEAGWYKITNPAFSYMVLGQYPAQGTNQLISREWTAAARARWDLYVSKFGEVPPRDVSGIMGFDIGEMGDDLSQALFRYGGYVERPTPETGWGGVDVIETGDKGSLLYHSRTLRAVAVDANGVGAGVAPHMRRLRCNAHGVKVQESPTELPAEKEIGEFKILRDQLWWSCREWLRADSGSMLPPDEELLEELHTATYEIKGKHIRVMDKDTFKELIKRSPNKADALCLTFAPIQAAPMPFVVKPAKKVRFAF